ncbi:P-loop containing nucleoside triphosphate hydrolase protein [Rickenella mellea]|uniref:P-loop containing nucleoside triphosphate hydrolase protein n=1 Tax=Rickenella mellea TaxID=50990 RepID=A0A4Y7QJ63_9AGAM|nr:P-loop containing nucleoside triphosphate hydrolase protein [Rickenella mellea]
MARTKQTARKSAAPNIYVESNLNGLPPFMNRGQALSFRGRLPMAMRAGNTSPEPGVPVPNGVIVEHDFDDADEDEDNDGEDSSATPPDAENATKDADTQNQQQPNHKPNPTPAPSSPAPPPPPPIPAGTLLEVKRVDEVYDRKLNEWKLKDSIVTSKKPKKDPYAAYAFTVNRKFLPTPDSTLHIIITTIDIKSAVLKKAGMEVVGQVQGISWTSKPLKVDPQHLLAFLPQFQEYVDKLRAKGPSASASAENSQTEKTEKEKEKSSSLSSSSAAAAAENSDSSTDAERDRLETIAHVSFLIDFLRTENAATLEELNSLITHDEITFDLLWALLVPRTILYTPCPITGEPRFVRLTHSEQCTRGQGMTFWRLDVEYVEYNGGCGSGASSPSFSANDQLGLANSFNGLGGSGGAGPMFGLAVLPSLEIPAFKGAAKIASLPVYPKKWCHGVEELERRLIERGRRWAELDGVHHMHYNATGFHYKDGRHVKLNTNSRIMIDWRTFAQTIPNYELPVVVRTLQGEDIDKHAKGTGKPVERTLLEDKDLMLASPIVYGFSLADKLWLEFIVDHVHTFTWNEEAFENLVLPRDQKSLIRSLVEAHAGAGLERFDDFVEGKGKGLVINLFGNPGVGKSLTAEATSEHVRKPLYVVGAGDLGTSSALLDANLTRIFTISASWGAVVLIDEADVFLEERSFHNLERNAMVAVFLRQLEYFRGILFLTTNRVKTFDEAFQSRIHVALRYQDLTADAKRQIWVAFIRKALTSDVTRALPSAGLRADQLHELGEKRVNGRQIKNVVRTASVLASSKGEDLKYAHLIQVLDMMEQFDASNAMYQ